MRNTFVLLLRIVRSEGIHGWYTGILGQITKASLSSALLLMTKEQIAGIVASVLAKLARR